ncbi:hypothetical protein ACMHYB_22085 [Sorangium sp. So ce1128]
MVVPLASHLAVRPVRPPVCCLLGGCAGKPDNIDDSYSTSGEGGAGGAGATGGAGGAPGEEYPGAPLADTEVAELALDVFGTIGNRYWFAVSEEQLEFMNLEHRSG